MITKTKLLKSFKKVFSMSSKELWLKKLERWPSVVLMLLAWGGIILTSSVITKLQLAIDNTVKGYVYASLQVFIGILIVLFSPVLGSFLYEANKRWITWMWFWKEDKEIGKDLKFPYTWGSTVWITRIVGIGLVSIAVSNIFHI